MNHFFKNQIPFSPNFIVLSSIFLFSSHRSMKENIIRSQPLDKQQTIAHWFDNLMENVERNLSMKNRDKYVKKFFILSCGLILIPLYLCLISDSVKTYRFSVVMSTKRWNKPIWMHPIPHQHLAAVRSTTWLSHSSCVTLQFFRMIAFFPYEKTKEKLYQAHKSFKSIVFLGLLN